MGCQALGQAAQGSDGISIPGSVEKICRCQTERYGLELNMVCWVNGWTLILEVSSNLNNSRILKAEAALPPDCCS